MVTSWPEGTPGLQTSAERLAQSITTSSDGRLKITVYPADSLVRSFEVFDAVAAGAADMYHTDEAYFETKAPALPKNLGEAVSALRRSAVFRKGFGGAFVDYFAHIKEAEFARFTAETGGEADVTAWEHNEYFDMF